LRLVIEVKEELHERLKERASKEGRTQSAIVRRLIEDYLKKESK